MIQSGCESGVSGVILSFLFGVLNMTTAHRIAKDMTLNDDFTIITGATTVDIDEYGANFSLATTGAATVTVPAPVTGRERIKFMMSEDNGNVTLQFPHSVDPNTANNNTKIVFADVADYVVMEAFRASAGWVWRPIIAYGTAYAT